MDDSGPKTIAVLVKTPSRGQEDHTVEGVNPDWTVKQLKTHLSAVYPTRPAESEQRLIYAGKLLLDHLRIRELFRQTDSTPTLHLVCAPRTPPYASLGARPKTNEAGQPRPAVPPSSSPPAEPPSSLRQRRPASSGPAPAHAHTSAPAGNPITTNTAAPSMTPAAFPAMSMYSPQQLLWLQQLYAHQYYMQYHAALAAAGSAPPPPAATPGQYAAAVPAHQLAVPAPLANQNPMDNLPANQNAAGEVGLAEGGAAAAANPNLQLNAQGGGVLEDEEEVERDWLDWLYSAARFCVLLTIVYFNSNLSRFLMVMATLMLMYLHTVGWFPFRRPAQAQGPEHLQPPEVRHNRANENRNPNPNAGEDAGADQSEGSMTAVLVPPHRVSLMWTAWVFFKTFFSSLIPEAAQGVVN